MKRAAGLGLFAVVSGIAFGCSAAPEDSASFEGSSGPAAEELGEQSSALYQDGCSAKFPAPEAIMVATGFSPSGGVNSFFSNACNRHDDCYHSGLATYGMSKGNCDDELLSRMKDHCSGQYPTWKDFWNPLNPIWRTQCQAAAGFIYGGVSVGGASSFKSPACTNYETISTAQQRDAISCSTFEPYDSSRSPISPPAGTCGGTAGQWAGCRGNGCAVCSEKLSGFPNYFKNHPGCATNTTCAGKFYTCNSHCPAPTDADR